MTNGEKFPNIQRWIISVAASNGMINRLEPVDDVIAESFERLFKTEPCSIDLEILDRWLNTLSPEDFDTLSDGEYTDILEVGNTSPIGTDGHHVSLLLEKCFDF